MKPAFSSEPAFWWSLAQPVPALALMRTSPRRVGAHTLEFLLEAPLLRSLPQSQQVGTPSLVRDNFLWMAVP